MRTRRVGSTRRPISDFEEQWWVPSRSTFHNLISRELSISPNRDGKVLTSRSSMLTGRVRLTSPSQVRTATTRCESQTDSWTQSAKARTGICTGEPSWRNLRLRIENPSLAKLWMPKPSGTKSPTRLGHVLTQEFSLTPPSTSGTPVRREGESTALTPARSTCS